MSSTAWLLVYLASALVFLIASGALDSIGWAFYRAVMRAAERKRIRTLLTGHQRTAGLLTGQLAWDDPRHQPWIVLRWGRDPE